nr:universal stress protein [Polymorphobacter fuscus]
MLHIHDDSEQAGRLQIAIDLARAADAHITCLQLVGLEPLGIDPLGGFFGLSAMIETIHAHDHRFRQDLEARLRQEGVAWDWRCFDGAVIETLIAQSRLADVLVISQPVAGRQGADDPLPIVADVVLHNNAPVLVVPIGAKAFAANADAMLAWNGSAEAAHAMRLALPLLKRAACVHIVEVSDDRPGAPAADAALFLARHGIACEVHEWPAKGRRTAVALRHAATELDARYVVMGAYGHSRLRETVLGGVTRELIQSSTVPLLLAH